MVKGNLAAIDLGTNSCRLLISDENGKILYREAQAPKLGENLIEKGCFTEQAIERGLKCLEHYADVMQKYDVQSYRAITTASCRMASNGPQFVQMVKELCGIDMEIISSEKEAELTLQGAILNADELKPYALVFDIGGGSTEITFAVKDPKPTMINTVSIPWGARNASEAFDLVEYDDENANNLRKEIRKYTMKFLQDSDFLECKENASCLATSSTPLRLVCMVRNYDVYDRIKADGITESFADLYREINKVYNMNFIQMEKNPLIGENRASIFVAACVIFETICKNLQLKNITASLKGAQEAILNNLIKYGDDLNNSEFYSINNIER